MPRSFLPEGSESRIPQWLATAMEAAKERGPYPRWVTGTIKTVIIIGGLTMLADWASHRSAKADLARLVVDTSQPKVKDPTKTGSIRRPTQ